MNLSKIHHIPIIVSGDDQMKLKPEYDAGKNLEEQIDAAAALCGEASKEKISTGAERQRRYRAMKRWKADPTEENFWDVVLAYACAHFKTYSGLPFTYEIRKGRNGQYTKELWIDRRENSKSLAWSSVLLALGNVKEVGEVVDRPKALGDIRGVTYIYGMFYRFGLIDVPDEVKEKMGQNRKK